MARNSIVQMNAEVYPKKLNVLVHIAEKNFGKHLLK